MMIAQHLHPGRTVHYLRMYLFENARSYALLYLAVAAFLVLWLGVYLNFTNPYLFSERAQVTYYFITLFLSGCLSSGMLFSELGSKPGAIHYLLVPASTLEKFLTRLVFGVFMFLVCYSSIFWLIDSLAVRVANYKHDTHWEPINVLALNRYPNPFFEGRMTDMFFMYFPAQALFIFCSVLFKNHGLFKAIVMVGLLWVVFIALFLLLQVLLPVGRFKDSIAAYEIIEASGDNKIVTLSPAFVMAASVFFKFLVTPFLWSMAYFKLKEKEL